MTSGGASTASGGSIQRHCVAVGDRDVHVRIAGSGPPLLLLHQSPKTGAEMEGLMAALQQDFLCIAPDSPGYGLSDPLGKSTPTMADLAGSVTALLDVLGLEQVYVYGFHTGAKIALAMAAHMPKRVAACIANGVLVNSAGDRQDLLDRYFPPYVPVIDGSHLTQLWHRMREQRIFFPFYNRHQAARIGYPIGSAGDLHANTMDFLASGIAYDRAYKAAMSLDVQALLPFIQVPTLVTCNDGDVLLDQVRSLRSTDMVSVKAPIAASAVPDIIRDHIHTATRQISGRDSVQIVAAHALKPGQADSKQRLAQCMVGDMHGLYAAHSDSPIRILFLPDLGGTVFAHRAMLALFAAGADILALDPLGFGWSGTSETGTDTDRLVRAAQDFAPTHIISCGFGAVIGAEIAAAFESAQLVLFNYAPLGPGYATDSIIPDLSPDLAGGHLAKAWWTAQERRKYWPGAGGPPDHAIPCDGLMIPADIESDMIALLNGWRVARQYFGALRDFVPPSGCHIILPHWAAAHPAAALDDDGDYIRPETPQTATLCLAQAVGLKISHLEGDKR